MVLKILTHDGVFHPDEIMAIGIIMADVKPSQTVIARSRKEALSDFDVVVDVGGQYSPIKRLFDHHQFEVGSPHHKYSSAGLVAKTYSVELQFRALINAVDQRDTRVNYDPNNRYEALLNAISACNANDIYSSEQNIMFNTLVRFFTLFFEKELSYQLLLEKISFIAQMQEEKKESIKKEVLKAQKTLKIKSNKGATYNIIVSKKTFAGHAKEVLVNPNQLLLTWDDGQSCWTLQCNTEFNKITGAVNSVFVHKGGFIAKIKNILPFLVDVDDGQICIEKLI